LRLETEWGIISNGVNKPAYIHDFQNTEEVIYQVEGEDAAEMK